MNQTILESERGLEESPTAAPTYVEANEVGEIKGGSDQGDEDNEMDVEEEGQVDEDEAEEGYTLQFDDHTDPLDFAQRDFGDVELYQQFERLEYEALAERKRKALQELDKFGEIVKKPRREDILGVTAEEINELMNYGSKKKRSRAELKKRGRKKGSKKKFSPEVIRKMGDATFSYACGDYNEAISLLEEVLRLAPNFSDTYNLLGMIYDAKGDRRKALNFYMIAAHLSPKDPSIWKKLVAWSIEQKNTGQVRYCLLKAITADPKDLGLRFDLALLYFELGEYQKAAESYDQILEIYPANVEACKMAAEMYNKCGQIERAIRILEDHVKGNFSEADRSLIYLLTTFYMEKNEHREALKLIADANLASGLDKRLPLHIRAKEAICHAHLGNMEHAEALVLDVQIEQGADKAGIITEVADSFSNLGQHGYALKFYFMLEEGFGDEHAKLHLKIAQCYMALKEKEKAIPYYYKALSRMENDIEARITLSSLLLEEGKEDETLNLLSPPKCSEQIFNLSSSAHGAWWQNGKIKLQLAKVYHSKGMLENFVDTIYPYVRETLVVETMNRKVRPMKKLTNNVLSERVKLLDEQKADNVFQGFKPVAKASDLLKAARAKKSLQKRAALKEERKAAALAAGQDWQSDSEDETPMARKEPPLLGFPKDEEHHQIILNLCKALASFRRYLEALEIINLTLALELSTISDEKKEEFRSLGAQIAYSTRDPKHGYNYVKCIVRQQPYSIAAWNCYYKVVSRFETKFSGHRKFLQKMRVTLKDCVMPMIINGNQYTAISQHQAAAEEYLKAYKIQPDNPLINLCVGTALINLALGLRLQNKHYCLVQGFAFLYNYLRICDNCQEALYNVARAYHHVGLVTLAAICYEKVLEVQEKDYPIPKLPYEDSSTPVNKKPGYCNLHREAAHNLHLIYRKSGATDLARQVLKNYCTF